MLEGPPKTGFDADSDDDDDNGRVMELVVMVMTILDLFPILMPTEDENCGVTFLSRCIEGILCVCVFVCVFIRGTKEDACRGEFVRHSSSEGQLRREWTKWTYPSARKIK